MKSQANIAEADELHMPSLNWVGYQSFVTRGKRDGSRDPLLIVNACSVEFEAIHNSTIVYDLSAGNRNTHVGGLSFRSTEILLRSRYFYLKYGLVKIIGRISLGGFVSFS